MSSTRSVSYIEQGAVATTCELTNSAFGDRTATLQLARSKEESAEKRKANKERRAAEKATKAQEQKEKTLAEGGVIGEGEGEGAAKPRRKRGDRVGPIAPRTQTREGT